MTLLFFRLLVPYSVAITAVVCAEEDRHTRPSHQEEDSIPPNINALRIKGLGGTDRLISLSTTDSGFLVDPIFPPYNKDSLLAGVADNDEEDLYEDIMKKLLDVRRIRSQKDGKATEEKHSSTRTSSSPKEDASAVGAAEPAEASAETVDGKFDPEIEDNTLLSSSMDADMVDDKEVTAKAQETLTDTEEENVGEEGWDFNAEGDRTVPTKYIGQHVASTTDVDTSQKEGNEEDASDILNIDNVADNEMGKSGDEETDTDFNRPEATSEKEHVSVLSDDPPTIIMMVDTADGDPVPAAPKRGEDERGNESGGSPASIDDSAVLVQDDTVTLQNADATSVDRVDGHAGGPEKKLADEFGSLEITTQSQTEDEAMLDVDPVVAVDELEESARDSVDDERKGESSDNSVNSRKYQQDLNVDTDEHRKGQNAGSTTLSQGIRSANNVLSESKDSDKTIICSDTEDVSPGPLSNASSNRASREERTADNNKIASKGAIGDIHESASPVIVSLESDNAWNGETVDHDVATSTPSKEHDDSADLSPISPLDFSRNDDMGQGTAEKVAQETIGANPADELVEMDVSGESHSAEDLIERVASNQMEQSNLGVNHDTCGNEAVSAEGELGVGVSKLNSKPNPVTHVVDAEEEDVAATSEVPSGTMQSAAGSDLESHAVRSELSADSEPQLDGMVQLDRESSTKNGTMVSTVILDEATDESHVGDDVGAYGEHVDGNIPVESTTAEHLSPDASSHSNTASDKQKQKAANEEFLSGFDDFDKLLEQVDPPDELDVAQGSSIQEVLVQKGTQILTKHVVGGVRRVGQAIRKAGSKAKRKFPKVFASKHGLIAIKEKAFAHNIGKYAHNFRRVFKRAYDNVFGDGGDDDEGDLRAFKSNIMKGSFGDKRENSDELAIDMEDIQSRLATQRQQFQERTKGKTGQELAAEFAKLKAMEREEDISSGAAAEKEP